MFNSVLKNEPSQLTLDDFFLCMVVSILLGILIAYTHMYQNNCTKKLHVCLDWVTYFSTYRHFVDQR